MAEDLFSSENLKSNIKTNAFNAILSSVKLVNLKWNSYDQFHVTVARNTCTIAD